VMTLATPGFAPRGYRMGLLGGGGRSAGGDCAAPLPASMPSLHEASVSGWTQYSTGSF
jgi:hypothetical protein